MSGRALSLPALSWALYDFANTIFSYVVVTRYFNDWIIEQRDTEDIWVGVMQVVVAVLLVLTLPVFGLFAAADVVPEGENQRAFLPAAFLFLVFALPCFLFVRERGPARAVV